MAKANPIIVPIPANAKFKNRIDERYGELLVVGYAGHRPVGKRKTGYAFWLCQCDCGETSVLRGSALVTGNTTSCGKCDYGKRRRRHGYAPMGRVKPEYVVWERMRSRCENRSDKYFHHYGGRGISVCARWQLFDNFIADMGPRPSNRHSIDRYPNNDGNYEPGNCRWATAKMQQRNKRNNHYITFQGKVLCLQEWSEVTGIPRSALRTRIRDGWSTARMLTTPVRQMRRRQL